MGISPRAWQVFHGTMVKVRSRQMEDLLRVRSNAALPERIEPSVKAPPTSEATPAGQENPLGKATFRGSVSVPSMTTKPPLPLPNSPQGCAGANSGPSSWKRDCAPGPSAPFQSASR